MKNMKMLIIGIILGGCLMMSFGMNEVDQRSRGIQKPIAKYICEDSTNSYSDYFLWETGDGHAAKTDTFPVNFYCDTILIGISSVTANPTVTVTVSYVDDQSNSYTFATFAALADGTNHVKLASEITGAAGDFRAFSANGTLVVSVDPSADPGGVSQDLTVVVELQGP